MKKNIIKLLLTSLCLFLSFYLFVRNSDGFVTLLIFFLICSFGIPLFFIYKYPKVKKVVTGCLLVECLAVIFLLNACVQNQEITLNTTFLYTQKNFSFDAFSLCLFFSLEFLLWLIHGDDYIQNTRKSDFLSFIIFGILLAIQFVILFHPYLTSYQSMEYFSQFVFYFSVSFFGYFLYRLVNKNSGVS